jgi:hypothetical protein
MEFTGTQYLLAVAIAGEVEFGTTNSLNGAPWASAIEQAIETSKPAICSPNKSCVEVRLSQIISHTKYEPG